MNAKKQTIVVVINKAGKVGKSTISKHLIAPFLEADWIQVETFNDSGAGFTTKVAGRKFEYVVQEVIGATSSLCIDIGNSNYQAVMKEMQEIEGFANRVHFWVVPSNESAGVMNDSLSTVRDLIEIMGVDPGRIIVLPNDIEDPEEGLQSFSKVALAAKKFGFHLSSVAIPKNSKFDVFNKSELSVFEIAREDVNYDVAIAAETNLDKRHALAQASILRSRARILAGKLKEVWLKSPLASFGSSEK